MWQPDGWARTRIGVLTPHADVWSEAEFSAMAPDGISIHAARVPFGAYKPGGTMDPTIADDPVRAFADPPLVDDAAELLASAPLHAIAYGFTSSSYVRGAADDAKLKERLERRTRGIPVVVPCAAAVKEHSKDKELLYVVKVDVANFFGALNLHELINVLSDSGYPKPLHSRLEALLTSFTGDRSSRGILQGLYPSDLFGNFYLAPIDTILEEHGVPSARYVDDIYIFVKSMKAAARLLRELIPALRTYDLTLNEAKSKIMLKSSLITEEPDLEALFADAVEEISSQLEDDDFDADYGFQSEWEDDDEGDDGDDDTESANELELKATTILFDSIEDYSGHEENIERFCLPLFAKAKSDYAVSHVMDAFRRRPAMSQIFSSYLANFLDDDPVKEFLLELLQDASLVDWQKMWVLAALSQVAQASDAYVKVAMAVLKDGARHDALRAVAAVYVGRFGEHSRRKALMSYYSSVSPYVQSAIYFSSRTWPSVERGNAKASWGSQSPLNVLLTAAITKK